MKRPFFILLLLIVIAIGVRVSFIGRYADSFDTVDFALGVVDFSVYSMQPHFPGYPIFMIMAGVVNSWLDDPVVSLSWISAICGALLPFPVYLIMSRLSNCPWMGIITAGFVAFNPLLWLYSLYPMSDIPGVLFIFFSIALLILSVYSEASFVRQYGFATASIFIFGLAMGIRLSYFPFAMMYLYLLYYLPRSWKGYLVLIAAGLGSILIWLLPTVLHEGGWAAYLQMGTAFTEGHFNEWGGTALQSNHSMADRIELMLGQNLLIKGVGGFLEGFHAPILSWFLISIVILFLLSFYRTKKEMIFYMTILLPYLIWSLLGQNADKPRHILILVPVLIIVGSHFMMKILHLWQSWMVSLSIIILLVYILLGWPWVKAYEQTVPPTVQLTKYLQSQSQDDKENTMIFTWEEERVIHYYMPDFLAERLKSPSYFAQKVLLQSDRKVRFFVTDAVLNGFGKEKDDFLVHLKPIAAFKASPVLYPTYYDIMLYEAKPSLIDFLKSRE